MNPFHIVVNLIKWLYYQFYPNPTVRAAQTILGYTFLRPSLLEEALTHKTNRRLEFVGDAALNLAMTSYLYSSHRDLTRGRISTLRSANVSNERLARVAVRHNIYPLMRGNSPYLNKEVEEFTEAVMLEKEDQIYGGIVKKAPKILANVVEAIAAAIYEDCNFNLDVMWEVVRKLLEPLITPDTFSKQPVTKLRELCQKSGKEIKFLTRQNVNTTTVEVLVDGVKISDGSAEQLNIAKLNAARSALEKLCGEKSDLLKPQHKKVAEEVKAKQKLNVLCAKRHWPLPVYKLEEKKGSAHNRTFICSVHVKTTNDYLIELGEERSRYKDAEKSAALKVVRKLLEPLITPDTFSEQPVTKLRELCQKSGKEIKFLTRKNVNTTTVEVLVDGVKISDGSAEQLNIAKLNAARSALEKLCGEKSDLLKPQHKKVAEEVKAKQKLNVLCAKRHWPLPVYNLLSICRLEEKKGPAFTCSVHVKITTNDYLSELGEERYRKKDAERSAALSLVRKLYGLSHQL